MRRVKLAYCKDCGTDKVIAVSLDTVDVQLCAPCLQTRAALQTLKEDTLPFVKLLALLDKERNTIVHHMIRNEMGPLQKLQYYKGGEEWFTYTQPLNEYWYKVMEVPYEDIPVPSNSV